MQDGGGLHGRPAGALQGSAHERVFKAGVQALGPPSGPRRSPLELKDRGGQGCKPNGSKEPISHGWGVTSADGVGDIVEVNGHCPPPRPDLLWVGRCSVHGVPLPPRSSPFTR